MPGFGSGQSWRIGGRYSVAYDCDLFAYPLPESEAVWHLKPHDQVLLLALSQDKSSAGSGFVLPSVTNARPGWIYLDGGYIIRQALDSSWDLKARYSVNHPCTIRAAKSLNSPILCEVEGGEEVLVLELGIATDVAQTDALSTQMQPRLRACVLVINSDTIGWLSPEPMPNIRLLEPVNLLGPMVVELHRRRTQSNASSLLNSRKTPQVMAWQEVCQYRTLEPQHLRSEVCLLSKPLTEVPAGTIVEVMETGMAQCPAVGACPSVLVYVCEGPSEGWEGWLRCITMEGHDAIDTRDQLAFEKIMTEKSTAPSGSINDDSFTAFEYEEEPMETNSSTTTRKDDPMAWMLGDSKIFGADHEQVSDRIVPKGKCTCGIDCLSDDVEDTFPFTPSDDKRQFSDGTIEEDAQCFSWYCDRRSDRNS